MSTKWRFPNEVHKVDDRLKVKFDNGRVIRLHFLGKDYQGTKEFTFPKQVHGDTIVAEKDCLTGITEADGITTKELRRPIAIQTADCVPVLIGSPSYICALHCGWRGLTKQLIVKAFELLGKDERTLVWIGPHISVENYEVGPELYDEIAGSVFDLTLMPLIMQPIANSSKFQLNLLNLTLHHLEYSGLKSHSVSVVAECTKAKVDRWHSFRRDAKKAGRNWSIISAE